MRKLTTLLMFFLFSVAQVWAQNRTVTGKVTDENGKAVAGASVTVTGSNKGTATKDDGTFTISVPANAKTLTITGSTLEQQKISIPSNGTGNLLVSIKTVSKDLEEVVVQVPYGSVKKNAFTGSEATITTKEIGKQQVTSISNVLEGLVSGVSVTNGGGQPGANQADIRIRGFGSINANSAPLYVLNGVPYDGDIFSIPTEDIESVSVLKDAAAASLYGSRAANGVIMLTTKKGKKGKLNVNLSVRHGFLSRELPDYNKLNQKSYYEMMWEAQRNSSFYNPPPSSSPYTIQQAGVIASQTVVRNILAYNAYNVPAESLLDPITGKLNPSAKLLWTDDWSKELFRKANRTNVGLNVSGASDRSDFYLSLGYLNEDGIVINSGYKRYNFRVNTNATPSSWFSTGLNMDATYSENKFSSEKGGDLSDPFFYATNIAPIYPVYLRDTLTGAKLKDANGYSWDWGDNTGLSTGGTRLSRAFSAKGNPVGSNNLDVNAAYTLNANVNNYVEIKFLKNFSFKNTIGVNLLDSRQKVVQNALYGNGSFSHGFTEIIYSSQISLTANQVLSWNKSFKNHNVRALAGHENYYLHTANVDATGINFKYSFLNELSDDSTIGGNPNSQEDVLKIESYFAGINYDYKGTYLFSSSIRRDGSSRFSLANRWGTFYSVGAGWRISQEKFLKNVSWINELKVKASYGEQGNQDLGGGLNYYLHTQWHPADGMGGFGDLSRKANLNLVWEGNRVANFGTDFSLFNRRLQGTIEYFERYSSNLLFDVPVAPASGYSTQYRNVGQLKNYGYELQLGYNAIRHKNFDWRIDLNLTTFKNVVTEMPHEYDKTNGFISGTKKISVGHSIYDFYIPEFAGVDAATGLALHYIDILDAAGKPTGKRTVTTDITKAGANRYYLGSSVPKFSGGITNAFRYRNWEVSFLIAFSYGGKFYDGNYSGLMASGNPGNAWSTDILNRWQKPGDVTNVPRVELNSSHDVANSSRFLFDASYLNFKNITFNYSLPKSVINKMKISGMTAFMNIDNVMLITSKSGSNPQYSFAGTSATAYPPFRTITFGTNINF